MDAEPTRAPDSRRGDAGPTSPASRRGAQQPSILIVCPTLVALDVPEIPGRDEYAERVTVPHTSACRLPHPFPAATPQSSAGCHRGLIVAGVGVGPDRGAAARPVRLRRQGRRPGRGGRDPDLRRRHVSSVKTATGLDGAFQRILDQPFGQNLLTAVALRFVAFGAFCWAQSRYKRL